LIISIFSNIYDREGGYQTSSELALNEPLVYVSTITFVMISFLIYLRIKLKGPVKNDFKQSKEINFT